MKTSSFDTAQAAQTITTLTTITTNNNLTTLMFSPEISDKQEQESYGHLLASPKGFAPRGVVDQNVSSPAKFRYVKLDLFDNSTEKEFKRGTRKLRLSLSLLPVDSSNYTYLRALLNSRVRDTKRGFNFDDEFEKTHYDLLIQTYKELKEMDYTNVRISKCYEKATKGKGSTIFGMSVVLAEKEADGEYLCLLIDGLDIVAIPLSGKGLSDKQRAGKCISSGQSGTHTIKRKTRSDLFK